MIDEVLKSDALRRFGSNKNQARIGGNDEMFGGNGSTDRWAG